jgi:hypothetical protein
MFRTTRSGTETSTTRTSPAEFWNSPSRTRAWSRPDSSPGMPTGTVPTALWGGRRSRVRIDGRFSGAEGLCAPIGASAIPPSVTERSQGSPVPTSTSSMYYPSCVTLKSPISWNASRTLAGRPKALRFKVTELHVVFVPVNDLRSVNVAPSSVVTHTPPKSKLASKLYWCPGAA